MNYNTTEYDEKICGMESSIETLKSEIQKNQEDFTFYRDYDAKNLDKRLQAISEDYKSKHSNIETTLNSFTQFQIEAEMKLEKIEDEMESEKIEAEMKFKKIEDEMKFEKIEAEMKFEKIEKLKDKIKELSIKISQTSDNPKEDDAKKDSINTRYLYEEGEKDSINHKQSFLDLFKDWLNDNDPKTSLSLAEEENNSAKLAIYDAEIQKESNKLLDVSEVLDVGTCIAIPNDGLFCFGNSAISDASLLIDGEFRVQTLSPEVPSKWSSAVYNDQNIYCFGGSNNIQY
ncbi:unnamed protein product [Blepharisma stoltei]|uniref:Uncharacterized protein n=1 Tax=Blepharisma stoltei TaxID=1481888 RepID=A0AAU9IZU5_9CILI|nr:unnamed protein product [Blepharisma stoltei]